MGGAPGLAFHALQSLKDRFSAAMARERRALEEVVSRPPAFDQSFRQQLDALFRWRRDVRRFQTRALPPGMLERLVSIADLAPSVGLSQPWRFVSVESPGRRAAVIDNFSRCNREALEACAPEDAGRYARLKLAGLRDAPEQLAVFCDGTTRQGRSLGRRTMPQTLDYSVVGAVVQLWLAARALEVGVGWVSILDAERLAKDLDAPGGWRLVAYLCLGYPEREDDTPELEREGWERRRGATLLRC
jgi:5,6-dimethylbenzimidazole synthase